jgi:putative tricarboxylic transport membrane protein
VVFSPLTEATRMSDRIFGSICIALAAFMAWGASVIEESFIQDPLGPKAFPIVIAIVLVACGVAIWLKPDAQPQWPRARKLIELLWAISAMVIYAQALPVVGFVIATAAAAGFLSWQLGAQVKEAAVAGVLIAVGIYAVFHLVLGLSLARGPLGF